MRMEIKMKTYEVRRYDAHTGIVAIVNMDLDQMVKNPIGLNMIDVGIALLNDKRISLGLPELPKESIAGEDY